MNNVKIVRLTNGIDAIGTIEEILEGKYVLTDPMEFNIQYKGEVSHIVMHHFLPVLLVEKNEVVLDSKDILFITTPKSDFTEYYQNSVERSKEMAIEENSFHKELQDEMSERIKRILVQSFESMEPEEGVLH